MVGNLPSRVYGHLESLGPDVESSLRQGTPCFASGLEHVLGPDSGFQFIFPANTPASVAELLIMRTVRNFFGWGGGRVLEESKLRLRDTGTSMAKLFCQFPIVP